MNQSGFGNDALRCNSRLIGLCDPKPKNIKATLVAALRDAYRMGSAGIYYSELQASELKRQLPRDLVI